MSRQENVRSQPSVVIDFADLHTYGSGSDRSGRTQRLPLSRFEEGHGHIHGALRIIVADQPLPQMGNPGPSDVCIGAWATELTTLRNRLGRAQSTAFTYDEGEQGTPAFHFLRDDNRVMVSVKEGAGGGSTDQSWRVEAQWDDLDTAIQTFEVALRQTLRREIGDVAEEWADRVFTERDS